LVNIDIDLLRTLLVVAKTGSFTGAGERLLRTQSAISLQIKRLEDLVGRTLVERGKGRELRLTIDGERVRGYAQQILDLNDALVRETASWEKTVSIRLGAPDDYANLLLPNVIKAFAARNRGLEFQIVSDLSVELGKMVESGVLDIAFVTRSPGGAGVTALNEPLDWVASPGLALRADEPVPLAMFPQGCSVRESAIQALDAASLRWRIAYSSSQFEPLRAAIAGGEAIGVLPRRAVGSDLCAIGREQGLPRLGCVEIVVTVSDVAPEIVHDLAGEIVAAFGPRTTGELLSA
jgi:DNA-binding transcriptional LysR family regulator